MKALSETLMQTPGVSGVLLLSREGAVLHDAGSTRDSRSGSGTPRADLAQALSGMREVELVFERRRIYARRVESGYLLVVMEPSASAAMIRLQCDALAPSIRQKAGPTGLGRLFRRAP